MSVKDLIYGPQFSACAELIGRTGAKSFQIRYSDDEKPVVWIALGEWKGKAFETASGMDPLQAVFRLLERVIDGGVCKHCRRPTGVTLEIATMPMNREVCWYQFDPETKKFRRGCEGD